MKSAPSCARMKHNPMIYLVSIYNQAINHFIINHTIFSYCNQM
uniref:Uncharacterized protein n=1 Tax=Anguilla anguilla TaxID=7936 RepID=A0A0E9SQF6_ANGAN